MAYVQADQSERMIHMTSRQFIGVAVAGLVTGIAAWVLGWLFDVSIFHPLLCQDAASARCEASPISSEVTALIIATGLGVFLLVRRQIFRPLLVGLAAALTLWGVLANLMSGAWGTGILVTAGLFLVSYLLYAWLARLRSLIVSVIAVVAVLILVRYLMTL